MEKQAEQHFEQILTLAREHFENIQIKTYDISEQRAFLRIEATFGKRRIALTEIVRTTSGAYPYYLLDGDQVILGWDNAPDRQALRLKYDRDFTMHIHDEIPHQHLQDGTATLVLEKTFVEFLDNLSNQGA